MKFPSSIKGVLSYNSTVISIYWCNFLCELSQCLWELSFQLGWNTVSTVHKLSIYIFQSSVKLPIAFFPWLGKGSSTCFSCSQKNQCSCKIISYFKFSFYGYAFQLCTFLSGRNTGKIFIFSLKSKDKYIYHIERFMIHSQFPIWYRFVEMWGNKSYFSYCFLIGKSHCHTLPYLFQSLLGNRCSLIPFLGTNPYMAGKESTPIQNCHFFIY